MNQQVLRFRGSLKAVLEDAFQNFRDDPRSVMNETRLEAAIEAYSCAHRLNDSEAIEFCLLTTGMNDSPAIRMLEAAREVVQARYQAVLHMTDLQKAVDDCRNGVRG